MTPFALTARFEEFCDKAIFLCVANDLLVKYNLIVEDDMLFVLVKDIESIAVSNPEGET